MSITASTTDGVTGWLHDKTIADAPDCVNFFSEWAEFLAQAGDVVIYGAVKAYVVIAPDLLQEDFTFEDPAGVGDEQYQQVVFFGGQFDLFAVQSNGALGGVD